MSRRSLEEQKRVPVRTCLGCRTREKQSSLARLVFKEGSIVVDESETRVGRGGYVHQTRSCVDRLLRNRKGLKRAFRLQSQEFSVGDLLTPLGLGDSETGQLQRDKGMRTSKVRL